MNVDINTKTQQKFLYFYTKDICCGILFYFLIEASIMFIIIKYFDLTSKPILLFAVLIILFVLTLSILIHNPNLLNLYLNNRWVKKSKERLIKRSNKMNNQAHLLDLNLNQEKDNLLAELNNLNLQKDEKIENQHCNIKYLEIEVQKKEDEIQMLKAKCEKLELELNDSQIQIKKLLNESPNNNMKIFIKSLICIFLSYTDAQNPRTIIIYDKKNGHGSNGSLQRKFDSYKSKKGEPHINGLICPITGDTLEDWLKGIDIKTK